MNAACKAFVFGAYDGYCELWSVDGPTTYNAGYTFCFGFDRTPSTPPAGQSLCNAIQDCVQCVQTNGCMYDDNWGGCRPSNECDYTYRPEPIMFVASPYGAVNEDSVNMNTACFVRADQCYRGGGGIIDVNAGGDACTRATTCEQCTLTKTVDYEDCIFDRALNLCKNPKKGCSLTIQGCAYSFAQCAPVVPVPVAIPEAAVCQPDYAIVGAADVPLSNGIFGASGYSQAGCSRECGMNAACKAFVFGAYDGYCELWSVDGPTTYNAGYTFCFGFDRTPSTPPAGQSLCNAIQDCVQCVQTNGCMYDDNWGGCRPSNECDFTYSPGAYDVCRGFTLCERGFREYEHRLLCARRPVLQGWWIHHRRERWG